MNILTHNNLTSFKKGVNLKKDTIILNEVSNKTKNLIKQNELNKATQELLDDLNCITFTESKNLTEAKDYLSRQAAKKAQDSVPNIVE